MHRALLMAHQDVANLVLLEKRVVNRQHRAAGIAEDVFDSLIGKRFDHHVCAGHFLCHGLLQNLSAPNRVLQCTAFRADLVRDRC